MKKIISILIIILIAIPMVFAQGPNDNDKKVLADEEGNVMMDFGYSNEKSICQQYIQEKDQIIGIEIPKFVPYKNEVFHAYYKDNTVLGSLEIVNRNITSVNCEIKGKPTFIIYVKDDETMLKIANAKNPMDAFNEAKKNNEISIKGVSFNKKIKNGFTNIAAKIASWFM